MDKYKIIQCSGHGTASTLLVNILTGLFYDKREINWISVSKPYDILLTNFITKTHKTDINSWLKNQKDSDNIFFIMSERKGRVPDSDRNKNNVIVFNYDELLETDENTLENLVTNVYKKLTDFLPKELVDIMNLERSIQRIKDMNCFYETIKHKPFKYFDKYYHLHGSHRNRSKK